MTETPYFITVEEARDITQQTLPSTSTETLSLGDAAGRVLAEDLTSRVDDPPFDNSSMDGFACRLDSQATYPLTLSIVGTQAASGENDTSPLLAGQAVRIMTGAPMPPGADSILPI